MVCRKDGLAVYALSACMRAGPPQAHTHTTHSHTHILMGSHWGLGLGCSCVWVGVGGVPVLPTAIQSVCTAGAVWHREIFDMGAGLSAGS
jgi:hypothetical protein